MGADAISVNVGAGSFEIFTNLNDAIYYYENLNEDDSNVFRGYSGGIIFLYEKNDFDKLYKPTEGRSYLRTSDNTETSQAGKYVENDICFEINYITEKTIDDYTITPYVLHKVDGQGNDQDEETDYYYLQIN